MQKPNDYDTTQAYGEFAPLKSGGYICVIKNVNETKSSTGKDMLIIDLDIAEGPEKGRFLKQYVNDSRDRKKWGCTVYQLIYDNDGNTNRGLKTFITAVKKSNPGFIEMWGDEFCASFKNKFVGGIFGREQYLNDKGEKKFSTKCQNFRSLESIREGVDPPDDKLLDTPKTKKSEEPFYSVDEPIDDSGLPF